MKNINTKHNVNHNASIKILLMQFFFCGFILLHNPAFLSGAENDYMLVLKDGSTIIGNIINPDQLESKENSIIKIKTSFGSLDIPGNNIIKFFKQTENNEADKTAGNKSTIKTEGNEITVKKEAVEKSANIETKKDMPVKANDEIVTPNTIEVKANNEKNTTETIDSVINANINTQPENITAVDQRKSEEKTHNENITGKKESLENELLNTLNEKLPEESTQTPKTEEKNKAENMLNVDDDKLLDMLGESKIEAPEPIISDNSQKSGEIETLKNKYTNKFEGKKELVPENLSDIKDDIKKIAASKTEELLLLSETYEVKVKTGDTKPVEVITVGGGSKIKKEKEAAEKEKTGTGEVNLKDKKDGKKSGKKDEKTKDNKNKNDKNAKGKNNKKNGTTGEIALGTGEISLQTGEVNLKTGEISIDETIETEYLGGDNLSEKIIKEFKQHKGVSVKDVDSQSHLEDAIEKYIEKPNVKEKVKDDKTKDNKEKDGGKDKKNDSNKK